MSESTQKEVQRAVSVTLNQFENLIFKTRLAHGTLASQKSHSLSIIASNDLCPASVPGELVFYLSLDDIKGSGVVAIQQIFGVLLLHQFFTGLSTGLSTYVDKLGRAAATSLPRTVLGRAAATSLPRTV